MESALLHTFGTIAKTLAVLSVVLGLIGTWCIGWSVIDKFKGFELTGSPLGGSTRLSPEYRRWTKRNDRRTWWGLGLVTFGGALQIAALYIT